MLDLGRGLTDPIRPALCHRDLHLDNLRAGEDGRLLALLDFDSAEAWDPAVDLVKLRWLVFLRYHGASDAFDRAYFDGRLVPDQWEERIRLAALLELTNVVANARLEDDPDFERVAREHLASLRGLPA
jgi:aminoglycoside phosphotransferase (APT) family kinase protein